MDSSVVARIMNKVSNDLANETKSPDVIFLQKVRCKSLSPNRREEPHHEDYSIVESLFQGGPFQYYQAKWSLAETRYSGMCTLMHKRLGVDGKDTAFSMHSAIDSLLNK
jgi:exonuclease III